MLLIRAGGGVQVSHWDRKQEGTVPYRDFIDALAAL
jgi:hypothetical protein